MDVLKASFSPNEFTLRKGVPVKWVINGKQLNECNKTIVVPQYKLKIELHQGEQTIDFTPSESGVVPWSCWMGMIPGTFIVIEAPPSTNNKTANQQGTVPENKEPESIQDRWTRKFKSYWQKLVSALMQRS
jgi:plastocyanin domain-containing protein